MALVGAERVGQVHPRPAPVAAAGRRRRGSSRSTATTSPTHTAASVRDAVTVVHQEQLHARRVECTTTSSSVGRTPRAPRCAPRHATRVRTSSSRRCRTATTPGSDSAAAPCRAVSGSGSRSRGPAADRARAGAGRADRPGLDAEARPPADASTLTSGQRERTVLVLTHDPGRSLEHVRPSGRRSTPASCRVCRHDAAEYGPLATGRPATGSDALLARRRRLETWDAWDEERGTGAWSSCCARTVETTSGCGRPCCSRDTCRDAAHRTSCAATTCLDDRADRCPRDLRGCHAVGAASSDEPLA